MTADNAAREQALDVGSSFIVQAPAGSGKTELLIQRFLKLLTSVDTPDAVLAITFTRKASGEMRTRVLQALRRASDGVAPDSDHERVTFFIAREVLDRDRRLNWNLLRNPGQLRIETIDALCAGITQRMPWLSRFGAMPEISEKAEDLYHQAAQNTLRHVDDGHPALSNLLLHLDNDFRAAERLIRSMIEKREQWLRHTGANPDFEYVRQELESSLQRLIAGELQRLREGFTNEAVAEISLLLQIERFPEAKLDDLPLWGSVADLLLTRNGDWRKRVSSDTGFGPKHPLKPRLEQLLAGMQSQQGLRDSLRRMRDLPAPAFSDSQWQAMEAAVTVLTLAVAELQLVFRESGRVDFAELLIRASEALGSVHSPTDLALALGYRIQHVLVDEFQDTSYTQFQLLEKLTAGWEPGDGRTLFLVGDPMQSIYRFRQADVSLFLRARLEGIGAIRLTSLALTVNFRSDPDIVQWINGTFETILPASDDLESGAVSYSASVAGAAAGEAVIGLYGFSDSDDEARRVVELASAEGAGKTAVLVRSRSHLLCIVRALKLANVPYQAIEIDQLGERAVIEDLLALTLALLHPADRVSWLAILRAPWCALTIEDLHALAAGDHHPAVWDLLHRAELPLSADGVQRIGRVLPILKTAIAQRGRAPLRAWVEDVWRRLGGPECVFHPADLEDAAAYFELLEEAQQGADLADFDWFRERVNGLFAQPDADAGDRLQLMTIHKAKGLEFDTVILPGLSSIPRQEESRLLLWLEQRGEFLLAPISESGRDPDPIYHYLARIERRKLEHETARLLYVAATRARKRLYLLSCLRVKEDGSFAEAPSGSFLKLLGPETARAFIPEPRPASEAAVPALRPIRRAPADWTAPPPPPPVIWAHPPAIVEAPRVAYEWAGDRVRHAGTAIHGFLERIAREGLEKWNEAAVRSQRAVYRSVLSNLGVPASGLAEASEHVEKGLLRTLRDPKGRWILGRHKDDEYELQIAGLVDGVLREMTVDRTFVDEDGVRWIIDYKSSVHPGGDLETFLDNEKERYREQLTVYARLLVQRDERPIRLALYFPLLGAWREWSAPTVLRRQASLFEL